MDNTTVFSTRGESYDRTRPGYPEALIDYLYTDQLFSEASAIADIGSGTGKFAQQLLVRGSRVFCVEPNDEMRQIAERKLSYYQGFISVNGTASFTGIKEKVGAVTAAQAFHWFDRNAFREECRRLLRPGGKVFLIWNFRFPDDEITNTCWEVFRR
jgi:SAM-dependent methyltransferase